MLLRCVGFAFCKLALTCSLPLVLLGFLIFACFSLNLQEVFLYILNVNLLLDFKRCKYFLSFFFCVSRFFIEQNLNFYYNLIHPFIPPSRSCLGSISPFLVSKGGFLVCCSSTLVFVFIFVATTYLHILLCGIESHLYVFKIV